MSGVDWLSDFKLRGSYGEVGNDRIGDYRYQATIDGNYRYNYDGNTITASTISALANEDVKWESTKMTNVGIDMGFFNDKLRANVEWFKNDSEGLLLNVPIPFSLGYDGAPVANVGTVSNQGFEFALGYQDNEGEFTWSLDATFSTVKNELVSLGIGNSIFGPAFEGNPVTLLKKVSQLLISMDGKLMVFSRKVMIYLRNQMRHLVISGLKILLVLRMKMGIQLVLMESLMQMTVQTWVISCLIYLRLKFYANWKILICPIYPGCIRK
jgi:hypothetical protein